MVLAFARLGIADTVAFAALGRSCCEQLVAERVLEYPVPIPGGINVCRDIRARKTWTGSDS